MMMKYVIIVAVFIILSMCTPTPEAPEVVTPATSTPTRTTEPTVTATATETSAPVPTNTPAATEMPTATAASTVTATAQAPMLPESGMEIRGGND
jgi:hypothetical protein